MPWPQIIQVLVILVSTLLAYWPVFHGDWLWDDNTDVTGNPITQSPTGLWKIWFDPGSQLDYYPIKASVQWAQWQLWRADTLGYHLTNIFLHVAGALLVWKLLGKFGLKFAWLGGLIFAIHPVNVESVAWIAELKNTLSLPPLLLAMCAWIDYDAHGRRKDYLLALGFFLVAILCKTTVVMFPVILLLHSWWKRGQLGWADFKASAPFFALSLILGLVTLNCSTWYAQDHAQILDKIHIGGPWERLALGGTSLAFYLLKCVLPIGLLPIYPKWTVDPPSPIQFLPWLILAGGVFWFWSNRMTWGRHALLGIGFFFINLVPFLGFEGADYMKMTWVMDHFLYLPIIGLIGLAMAGWERLMARLPVSFRPYALASLSPLLLFLLWLSYDHATVFASPANLWTYTVERNPDAWLARNNLGIVLLNQGRLPEAMDQFVEALRLNPDYPEAHNNYGGLLHRAGRLPEALEQFQTALRLHPGYVDALYNLGNLYQQENHLPEAEREFREALRLFPDGPVSHYNLATVLSQTGRLSEAAQEYQEALRLNPQYTEAYNNLGGVLVQAGHATEAQIEFEAALELNPNYADAHNNLGIVFMLLGQPDKAKVEFETALLLNPNLSNAKINLDRLLAPPKLPGTHP